MNAGRAEALNIAVQTPRLVLEPIASVHADVFFDALMDDRIYTWISTPKPASPAWLRERFARLESRLSPSAHEAWLGWAVRRATDDAFIGHVDISVDDTGVATNVGYLFLPPFWGNGYAREAVEALVSHLGRSGVTEHRAYVTRGNDASVRLLERIGFVHTRVLPDNETIRGEKYDDLEFVRS